MPKIIDINADVGEGTDFDASLMPYISSCSIACGGHYGTKETILETIQLAQKYKVKVGAHPSFPDSKNFGRKVVTMTKKQLTASIASQLQLFFDASEIASASLHHIKLHGALYHYAATDAPAADAVIEAVLASKQRPKLYVPYGSVLHRKAENLLPLVFEAFIDRRYEEDLSLVHRTKPNAIIEDKELAWRQLYDMVIHNHVQTISGSVKNMTAQTFCVHGDHRHTLEILQYIHQRLQKHQIIIS